MQVGSRVFLLCIVYFKVERQSNLTDKQRLVPNTSSRKRLLAPIPAMQCGMMNWFWYS
jgi:hypothetical protein